MAPMGKGSVEVLEVHFFEKPVIRVALSVQEELVLLP